MLDFIAGARTAKVALPLRMGSVAEAAIAPEIEGKFDVFAAEISEFSPETAEFVPAFAPAFAPIAPSSIVGCDWARSRGEIGVAGVLGSICHDPPSLIPDGVVGSLLPISSAELDARHVRFSVPLRRSEPMGGAGFEKMLSASELTRRLGDIGDITEEESDSGTAASAAATSSLRSLALLAALPVRLGGSEVVLSRGGKEGGTKAPIISVLPRERSRRRLIERIRFMPPLALPPLAKVGLAGVVIGEDEAGDAAKGDAEGDPEAEAVEVVSLRRRLMRERKRESERIGLFVAPVGDVSLVAAGCGQSQVRKRHFGQWGAHVVRDGRGG